MNKDQNIFMHAKKRFKMHRDCILSSSRLHLIWFKSLDIFIVTVVDWSTKSKPPHGISCSWSHESSMAINITLIFADLINSILCMIFMK